jgi:hypothetical protein
VSASYEQRAFEWGIWLGGHIEPDGMKIVGFVHQCGTPNLFLENASHVGGDTSCRGCHFEIQRPASECTSPLWAQRGCVL